MTKCLITQIPAGLGPELVAGDTPLGAVIMSIVMAGLRIAYFGGGGGWKRKRSRFCYVAL